MPLNLFEHLRQHWPADLEQPVMIHPDGRWTSYRLLLERSGRVAATLQRLGVAAGGRVAVQVEKCEDFLNAYLGCLRAEAIIVPLNPAYTADEVAYYLDDSHPTLFICQPERLAELQPVAHAAGVGHVYTLAADGRSGSFQALLDGASFRPQSSVLGPRALGLPQRPGILLGGLTQAPAAPVGAAPRRSVAAILYTSGTTGRPKGAMLSHGNLIANVDALHAAWGWRADDVLLHALPLFHVHGLFVAVNGVLRAGACMIFLPRFEVDDVLQNLPASTVFMGVPTMYHRLAQDPRLTVELCRGMRLFVSGSAPLTVQDFAAFRRRTGHAILERYGMTETGMNISNPLHGPRKAGSVGVPLAGVEVRLVSPQTLRDVPQGEVGEIWVRGANVFAGYFERPEETTDAFVDGWFRTGDLARQDADGCYEIVGRCKELIISGGLNVYPAEVERVLNDVEGVEESSVFGVPDADLGETVVAAVVREHGHDSLTPDGLMAAAREHLAGYKCPKQIMMVESLPRNATGKVEKGDLQRFFRQVD